MTGEREPRERDPLGKRALFSGKDAVDAESASGPEQAPTAEPSHVPERSPAVRKPGPLDVTVECSACHETSTTSAAEMAFTHLPVVVWLPWRKQPLLMRCPACGRVAWHAAKRG